MLIIIIFLVIGIILTFFYIKKSDKEKRIMAIAILLAFSTLFLNLSSSLIYTKFFDKSANYVSEFNTVPIYNDESNTYTNTYNNSNTIESEIIKDLLTENTTNNIKLETETHKFSNRNSSEETSQKQEKTLIAKELNGKWGFVDSNDKTVIPFIYDFANDFSEGLASVRKNYSWGYIDTSGNTVIPFIYDGAWSFINGAAPVFKDNLWGFIDKDQNIVIDYKYINISLMDNKYYDENDNQIIY